MARGNFIARDMGVISAFLGKHKTHRHRMVCDMCSGVIMSSRVVSFRLAPRRLASWRSLPDRLHCWKNSILFIYMQSFAKCPMKKIVKDCKNAQWALFKLKFLLWQDPIFTKGFIWGLKKIIKYCKNALDKLKLQLGNSSRLWANWDYWCFGPVPPTKQAKE